MNTEDLLLLIKAGYTKADIDAMNEKQEKPVEKPAKLPDPEEKPEEKQEEKTEDPVMTELKALKDQISKLSVTHGAAEIPKEEDKLTAALSKLIGG